MNSLRAMKPFKQLFVFHAAIPVDRVPLDTGSLVSSLHWLWLGDPRCQRIFSRTSMGRGNSLKRFRGSCLQRVSATLGRELVHDLVESDSGGAAWAVPSFFSNDNPIYLQISSAWGVNWALNPIEGPTSGLFFMFKSITWKKSCWVGTSLEETGESADILKVPKGNLQSSRVSESTKFEGIHWTQEMMSGLRGCAYNIERYAEGSPFSKEQGRKTSCYIFK